MDCSLNGATGANSTLLLVIAAVVLCGGAVAVVMSRRKAPALAAMALAFVAVGVGGAAGRADAAAQSCAGFPVCINVNLGESGDVSFDTTDGVHLIATEWDSTDGSCSGPSLTFGFGVIAPDQASAEALCGTDVVNLNSSIPAGSSPMPPTNWWGCTV